MAMIWMRGVVCVAVLAACDDGKSDGGGAGGQTARAPGVNMEAGPIAGSNVSPDATAPADVQTDASMDGAAPVDARADASMDGAIPQETCPRVEVKMWEVEPGTPWTGTLVPLEALCPEPCEDLAAYERDLDCSEPDQDAGEWDALDEDAGVQLGDIVRTEGCGRVQFERQGWPRYSNYDADTGVLVGAGRLDDIFTTLPTTGCEDAIYVAGEYDVECEDATRSRCRRRRE